MVILVCGGRGYFDRVRVYRALDRLLPRVQMVITGGATGADTLALEWAAHNGVPCRAWHADWASHGYRAGPERNQRMLDEGRPGAAVAFPGGMGTADMCRRLVAAGVPIWRPYG